MCFATACWAGLDAIVYGATVADAKLYGNFDDAFIYRQFSLQRPEWAIAQIPERLRDESIEVGKEYAARPDKIDYGRPVPLGPLR